MPRAENYAALSKKTTPVWAKTKNQRGRFAAYIRTPHLHHTQNFPAFNFSGSDQTIDARFRSPVPSPWGVVKLWRVGPGLVTLMNMSCVAFMCHYNGVKYYEELEDRTEKKYAVTIG